jgi:WD40 repeat protein
MYTCCFHPHATRVLAGNRNGDLTIWDLANGFQYQKGWAAHPMSSLTCMAWSHNQQYLITGDANGTVKYASRLLFCGALYVALIWQFRQFCFTQVTVSQWQTSCTYILPVLEVTSPLSCLLTGHVVRPACPQSCCATELRHQKLTRG